MRKVVVLVAVLASSVACADWFCDSLEFNSSEIMVKNEYVSIIKNFCDNVVLDYSGRCHLIEFHTDGTAAIKNTHEDAVKDICINNKGCSTHSSNASDEEDDEPSWFVQFLISLGNNTPHWRR